MKQMYKRVISLALVLLLILSMPISAFAIEEVDPYAEMRASIYRQLESQNALHLYDHFCNILIPSEQEYNPMATNGSRGPWYAPNGGVLHYTYDYTYRGEDGYVSNIIYFLDKEATDAYLESTSQMTGWDILSSLLGLVSFPFDFMLNFISTVSLLDKIMASASINDAGGYAKVATVYDSISMTNSTVVVGWSDYPTVAAPRSDAYNVSFQAALR